MDKKYRIAYLENKFVRIGILPEIGGRLFEAVDKTNNYDFIYRQHVIKPALIGLIGAWISGCIEWNIPHHHRAMSAFPVHYKLEKSADGSRTIWVGELEVRALMRWAVGYTLRPGKSYLEAKVRILNRTPVVETMLCFANVAVHVNENYQTILARTLGRPKEALQALATARRVTDPLDVRVMAEQWLTTKSAADAGPLDRWKNRFPALAEETAAEMMHAGLWKDGAAVLSQAVSAAPDKAKISPMVYYYLAQFASKSGQAAWEAEYYTLAKRMHPDYVFPVQYEAIEVLRAAGDSDARAQYYLGNLLYDWQPEVATKAWERSAVLDPSFAIVQRNLAVAYSHRGETAEAIARLEKAVALERRYPLHFTELHELYEGAATAPEKRLAVLEKNHGVVAGRDDSLAREIAMKVFAGKYDEAI